MEYKEVFFIIFIISSFLGIILAVLNNDSFITKKNRLNKENKNILRTKDNKNDIIDIIKEKDEYNINLSKDNKKRSNIVPIAINIDNNYYLQAIVFLVSLLENISTKTKYEIYIMIPNDFEEISKKRIDSLLEKYGKDKISFKYINMKNIFFEAVTNEFISITAYYRLLLPSLLPNLDKIIYCDCDIISFGDLTNLYNQQLNDNIYFIGILDYYSNHKELLKFGINTNIYINSGILLMNLKSLRKNGIENDLVELCESTYLEHHDQTAINMICSGYIGKLPIKYGIFNFESYEKLVEYNNEQYKENKYSKNELKEGFYNPILLHFAGFDKPWNHKNIKYQEYWWYYASKTDYFEEILNIFEYTYQDVINIIENIPYDRGFIRNKR